MKKSIKSVVLSMVFLVLIPIILLGLTTVANKIVGKGNTTVQQQQQSTQNQDKVNENIPKNNENKAVSETTNNNNSSNSADNTQTADNANNKETATNTADKKAVDNPTGKPMADQEYTIKSGDTLFQIAISAYGETNSQKGLQKIREANNLQGDNLSIGQKIKIPKL